MSSRALRKLQQGQGLENERPPSDDDISVSRPAMTGARAKVQNPFDLLNDDSCSESEVKEDDDLGCLDSSNVPPPDDGKKKKKRKNKKRKGGHLPPPKSSEDNLEDEVERSVREVNRLLGEAPQAPNAAKSATPHLVHRSLLSIEHKNLNPENEMKKIFGARVVLAEQQHRQKRAGGARSRAHPRSSHWLVVPKPSWPHPGKTGLGMKFLESDSEGNQVFTFEHNPSYQAVQKRFFHAVDTLNPEFIIQLLNDHPFHIDAMLQLSEICKMGEDSQRASELIERTLYAMETAFHPLFNLAVGTSRLSYRRQENRAFFIALFKHLNYVGSRACHRTALEFCKLALGLDPDADPLGILLMIDFYAIRAQQHSWFLDLIRDWEPKKNLTQLPNIAYSLALAELQAARSATKTPEEADTSKADTILQNALIMFPGVLWPLLDKCSVDIDKRLSASSYFVEAQSKQPPALQLLCKLYVGRSYHLWKEPSLLPWLEKNVHTVLDRIEAGDPFIKECEDKRKSRYQGTPRNVYRHIILSDIQDATASLPRELADQPVMSYDPLPPTDAIDTYKRSDGSRPNLDDPSVLGMFFRSLLPNFNPNDPAAPAPEGGAEGGGAEGGGRGDLRSSVTSLLDAMQDLLGGLHLPEVPHEDASEEDDADDENWQ